MCECLNPVHCWKCGNIIAKDGVKSVNLVFSRAKATEYFAHIFGSDLMAELFLDSNLIKMPCGKCDICQIRKRKDMSVRLTHEASMHQDCCFLTITYDNKHLPMTTREIWGDKSLEERAPEILRGGKLGFSTLLPADVQKFMKRLRRHLEYLPKRKSAERRDHVKTPIRYFCVGEYGSNTFRPHYHILIFGWKPSDLTLWQVRDGYNVYRSAQIEKLWTFGFSTVGDVNAGVAKYCARYVTKKFAKPTKPREDEKYVCPEFFIQSVRGGGMGSPWLEKYYQNLKQGYVTCRTGKDQISKFKIPRYYYNRLRIIKQAFWLDLRDERIEFVKAHLHSVDMDELMREVAKYKEEYKRKAKDECF